MTYTDLWGGKMGHLRGSLEGFWRESLNRKPFLQPANERILCICFDRRPVFDQTAWWKTMTSILRITIRNWDFTNTIFHHDVSLKFNKQGRLGFNQHDIPIWVTACSKRRCGAPSYGDHSFLSPSNDALLPLLKRPTVGGQPRCFCESPELGVSINGSTPIAGWFTMEHPSINGWFGGTPPFMETSKKREISKTWTAKQRWWLETERQQKKNMSWSFPAREAVTFLWRYARQVIQAGPKLKSSDCIQPVESLGRSTQETPHISWHKSMDGFQSLEAIATLTDSQNFLPLVLCRCFHG